MKKEFGSNYASITDVNFTAKYRASCYCDSVQYEVCSDPVDAKICHCLACQKLHGAPMQWAAIFHKHAHLLRELIRFRILSAAVLVSFQFLYAKTIKDKLKYEICEITD